MTKESQWEEPVYEFQTGKQRPSRPDAHPSWGPACFKPQFFLPFLHRCASSIDTSLLRVI